MVADCGTDEPEVLSRAGEDSADSSIGDGSAVRVSAGERAGEEGVLLVAVPGGDGLRVFVEAGAQGVQAEPGDAEVDGRATARTEVSSAGVSLFTLFSRCRRWLLGIFWRRRSGLLRM